MWFILKLLILVILCLECYMCFHITKNPFEESKDRPSVRIGNKEFSDHDLENENPTDFKDISEIESNFWQTKGQQAVENHLKRVQNENVAENVIFFIGDGMSLTTVAAARIYAGQLRNATGEETSLSFEQFPHTGLSKTYCVDRQVADSACSGTALFTGVKTNFNMLGVNAKVVNNDCAAANNKLNQVSSILDWAQKAGKATGLVTDTKITSATPAAAYAHSASRKFECDADVLKNNLDPIQCLDYAQQLIDNNPGKKLNVIFGGGRKKFLPEAGGKGKRKDTKNLIEDWLKMKNGSGIYISDRKGLLSLKTNNVTHALGLFASNNIPFKYEATDKYPSLDEMTSAAIKILKNIKPSNGYVLLVEGGRIDHAHHDNAAQVALQQTVELSKTVSKAIDMINTTNTLVVVTSDHGHTMSFAGYNSRGSDILGGIATKIKKRRSSYPALSYANGPGYRNTTDILNTNYTDTDVTFMYPATVPLELETHGGEDVGVYAIGPWSHLFTGVYEQNIIPHLIAYAACIGDGVTKCGKNTMAEDTVI